MKRMINRICVSALVVCMLVAMLAVPLAPKATAASSNSSARRYNIMLVIDGSGSLISQETTDPDGLRYELVKDLLGVLEDDGHYVGAVVFSGNSGRGTTKADMESGIRCNTGMVLLDGSRSKESIYNQIERADVDKSYDGKTDIGTALLVAERIVSEKQKENGLPSLIFLFTDGHTDVKDAVKEQSDRNLATAIQEIKENDIRLFGAFLNKDGKLSSEPITDIVCDANDITSNSLEFTTSFCELEKATDVHKAVNTFLRFLGYIDDIDDGTPRTESFEEVFTIPGIGVEELNIRMYSCNGEELSDETMQVELTQPDGTGLKGDALNALSRSGRTFRVYKLVRPMSGTWKLKVTIAEGKEIEYVYSRVFSKHVDAELTLSPAVSNLHVNANVDFTATLIQNGTAVTNQLAYSGYECRLQIKNLADNTTTDYDIPGNGANLVYNMDLQEYGAHAARVVFYYDSF